MTVQVALHTLKAIDEAIRRDGGSAYRGWLGRVMPHIGDAYRTDEDDFRSHLGASILGGDCIRSAWYGFRWATKSSFDGRMLRLFNRGHIEEARFVSLLLTIGCHVYQQDENGKQFRISFAEGHAGGSGDGIAVGVPDALGMAVLCEFKTHSEKSFIELAGKLDEWRKFLDGKGKFTGKGVREAKPEHYIQMNLYMGKMGLSHGLYVAVNKNTDDLYAEIVPFDPIIFNMYIEKGEQVVWSQLPPKGVSTSPGFWKCRFCDHNPVCHLRAAPAMNCRTCAWSRPVAGGNGTWICENPICPGEIDKKRQLQGCSHYELSGAFSDS